MAVPVRGKGWTSTRPAIGFASEPAVEDAATRDYRARISGTSLTSWMCVRRVAVVGPGGAGKSTFSDQLGARLGLPVIHLDEHYWRPGWIETPPDGWRSLQQQLTSGDRWVIDGNYGGTFDVRFAAADTVIVLAPPRLRCVLGALHRIVTNYGRPTQAPGCPERFDLAFLRWIWRYPNDSRPRLDHALVRYGTQLRVVELGSRRDATELLDRLAPPE